ncbi:tetratricopeptide repeat protein [Commensalibacter oyaizuii]|uniref:Tetratricopeptide repeat protein n=1 Tax=Commensalibacter oyaizuii TaxID=3043873 RepID=A0ABT6Q3S4_9PROT|nr:tetratricopeptide repeat protein [Commensalibacter sp. TBRC 16381]MDI2091771.1 tetratricopeptide repeat protein [Commensalibacter sp. TBRC 16381]
MRGLFGSSKKRQEKKIDKFLKKAKAAYDEQNYTVAFEQYSQAAALQSAEAQYWLGMCYLGGHGVVLSIRDAVSWHEAASAGGWVPSQHILALLYMQGVPETQEVTGANLLDVVKENYETIKPDLDKARFWAKKAAENGYAEGQALYAYLLSLNTNDEDVIKEALNLYDQAIAQDSAQGYMGKGLLLLRLGSTQEDYAKAAEFLKIAAERKMGSAIQKLGVMYATGQGVPLDYEKAAQYYKEAAELGIREAQALYGVALKKGQGVEQNFIQAETWLRKAAMKGDIEAAVVLADMNGQGNDDIPPNYTEAFRWYSYAAQCGHLSAIRTIGLLYLNGLGVEKSVDRAIHFFKSAAQKGDVTSIITLGDLALQLPQSSIDLDEIIQEFLIPGAEQGNQAIMFNLAMALLKSNSNNSDVEKEKQAREWLRRCCEEIVPARYWYARLLIQGTGGDKDITEGYKWMASAADAGFAEAQLLWAGILLEGYANNGQIMAQEALKYYHLAAEQGNIPAMFALGAMYGGGNHIEPDRVKAQEWFTKAAEKGHPKAQLMLGRYFAKGLVEEQNLIKARYWLGVAKDNGEKEAQTDLDHLEQFGALPDGIQNNATQDHVSDKKQNNNVEIAPGLFFVKSN